MVSNLQIAWLTLGFFFGLLLMIPFKRCKATHNGISSMLIASLLGILNIWITWVAVVIGLICFSYGLYQNQHKYLGAPQHDNSATE